MLHFPMRQRWTIFASLAAALLATTVSAQTFAFPTNSTAVLPDTPASTLLVPYFEVDLGNPNGMNTIFTINNSGSDALFSFNGSPPSRSMGQEGPLRSWHMSLSGAT